MINFMEAILWLTGFIFVSFLMDLVTIFDIEDAIKKGTNLKLNTYSIKYTLSSCFIISIVNHVYIGNIAPLYILISHLIIWCIVFLIHRLFILLERSYKRRYKKLVILSFILWAIVFINLKKIGVII